VVAPGRHRGPTRKTDRRSATRLTRHIAGVEPRQRRRGARHRNPVPGRTRESSSQTGGASTRRGAAGAAIRLSRRRHLGNNLGLSLRRGCDFGHQRADRRPLAPRVTQLVPKPRSSPLHRTRRRRRRRDRPRRSPRSRRKTGRFRSMPPNSQLSPRSPPVTGQLAVPSRTRAAITGTAGDRREDDSARHVPVIPRHGSAAPGANVGRIGSVMRDGAETAETRDHRVLVALAVRAG
jgi:hypothetical protein